MLLIASGLATLAVSVVLLVFLCLDSEEGPNKYGASPKQPVALAGDYRLGPQGNP